MVEGTRDHIAEAVKVLRAGGLVAFPTETVYGLGADARSSDAVKKIFAAKGRVATNPLIVHVADKFTAQRYAARWPNEAVVLAEAFWPGPLTLVVPKTEQIVAEATAGLSSVGLRVPGHPLALEMLRAFDGPVAAPSANPSGRVSPTTAEHVRAGLGDRVDLILDGGACRVGIESTVLDLSGAKPVILRPGGVERRQIEEMIGPVDVASGVITATEAAPGPGMQAEHYRPLAPMFRFEADQTTAVEDWCRSHPGQKAAILCMEGGGRPAGISGEHGITVMPSLAEDYANVLYAKLHEADRGGVAAIWVQMPPAEPAWAAVRDRLIRASKPT
jgi:L-threonylcarbamoyladenylate synthase